MDFEFRNLINQHSFKRIARKSNFDSNNVPLATGIIVNYGLSGWLGKVTYAFGQTTLLMVEKNRAYSPHLKGARTHVWLLQSAHFPIRQNWTVTTSIWEKMQKTCTWKSIFLKKTYDSDFCSISLTCQNKIKRNCRKISNDSRNEKY